MCGKTRVPEVEIRSVRTDAEMDAVLSIREQVFVRGQNVPVEIETDGLDKAALTGRPPVVRVLAKWAAK